jgi:hypothetical protein
MINHIRRLLRRAPAPFPHLPHIGAITPEQRLAIAQWATSDATQLVLRLLAAARPLPAMPTTGDAQFIGTRAVAAVAYAQGFERALLYLAGIANQPKEPQPLTEDWTTDELA